MVGYIQLVYVNSRHFQYNRGNDMLEISLVNSMFEPVIFDLTIAVC